MINVEIQENLAHPQSFCFSRILEANKTRKPSAKTAKAVIVKEEFLAAHAIRWLDLEKVPKATE
jgi:hypothetical protein